MNKTFQRFLPIFTNGLRSVLNPLFSIGFSYVVVNYFSKELWGDFVEYILFFLIANIICSWGDKGYLLRVFSNKPKDISTNWQNLLVARVPIVLIFSCIIVFVYPAYQVLYLILWLVGLFLYSSFSPIIYYNRDYIRSILIETVGFSSIIVQLYFFKDTLNLELLLRSYSISILIKTLVTILFYGSYLKFKILKFNIHVLKLSLPFLILSVTGFFQSKIDIYAYSLFYKGKLLGEYQVISGLFIFASSLITLLSFPFIKNIYRLKADSILNLKKLMMKYGLLLNLVSIVTIYFTLLYGFNIRLSFLQISLGYLISYPSYVYTTHIYNLIKNNKENIVIKIGMYSLLINLLFSLFLLYLGFDFTGVIAANALAQLFCMFYSLKFKINVT